MKKNAMYFNTHAIKIHKDSYRPGLNISHFFKYLCFVLFHGVSPIEHRPGYARKSKRY